MELQHIQVKAPNFSEQNGNEKYKKYKKVFKKNK